MSSENIQMADNNSNNNSYKDSDSSASKNSKDMRVSFGNVDEQLYSIERNLYHKFNIGESRTKCPESKFFCIEKYFPQKTDNFVESTRIPKKSVKESCAPVRELVVI